MTRARGGQVVVESLAVTNAGWRLVPAGDGAQDILEAMRGYTVDKAETREIVFSSGEHVVNEPW